MIISRFVESIIPLKFGLLLTWLFHGAIADGAIRIGCLGVTFIVMGILPAEVVEAGET
jgi:hypothetical protein